jgi:hypothetical protein
MYAAPTNRFVCQQQRDEIMWRRELFVNFFFQHFLLPNAEDIDATTDPATSPCTCFSASNFTLRSRLGYCVLACRFQQRPNYSKHLRHWQAVFKLF